jgi:hypothetical protein
MKKRIHNLLLLSFLGISLLACVENESHSANHNMEKDFLSVPPDGLEQLDENDLAYYQQMGPLEYSAHALKAPAYPAWRLHFSLQPTFDEHDASILSGYQVQADQINLSQNVYQELLDSLGEDAVDKTLNDNTPHHRYILPYFIVQTIAADFLPDEAQHLPLDQTHFSCGLQKDCGATWQDNENNDWGEPKMLPLEQAPWKTQSPIPELTRLLAKQANWLQHQGHHIYWTPPELPEGLNAKRPWVSVTIDNYAGNGGAWVADWVETVADDSIASKVVRIMLPDSDSQEAMVFTAYQCHRTEQQHQVMQACP